MRVICGVVASLFLVSAAMAQSYPARPIRLIVPFAAGAGADIATRFLAEQVQRDAKATLVIENIAGALGIIGVDVAKRAEPDGYTLVMTGVSTHSLAPHQKKEEVKYDPVRDFSHILRFAVFPFAIAVGPAAKAGTIKDLIQEAKASPGKLTWAFASGAGQMIGVTFNKNAALNVVDVPYKGTPQGLTDLMAGRVDYMLVDVAAGAQLSRDRKIKILALAMDERSKILPEVPTLAEAGAPTVPLMGWSGIAGPAGLAPGTRQWLQKNFMAAMENPDLLEKLKRAGVEPAPSLKIEEWVSNQLAVWGQAVQDTNARSK